MPENPLTTLNQLPTLYRRTAKKKVEQWTIFTNANTFWTESGEIGGKITKSNPTVCKSMNVGRSNETTPEAQAQSEAKSKWTKKAKTGYFEDIARVDDFYFVEAMLATPLKNVKGGLRFPNIGQIKFNGARQLHTSLGGFSREGELWETAPHVTSELQALFFPKYPDAMLDGELFCYENRAALNETMKLIKRKPENFTEEDRLRSEQLVRYHIYNGYGFEGLTKETPYLQRLEVLSGILTSLGLKYSLPVESVHLTSQEEVDAYYQSKLDEQHEGVMIKYATNTYRNGIRSKDEIKLKPDEDAEGVILAIEEGSGNWAGAGKIIYMRWNGVDFKASYKGTMKDGRTFLAEKDQWIGKTVTFKYLHITNKGVPYSARLDYKNCLKH